MEFCDDDEISNDAECAELAQIGEFHCLTGDYKTGLRFYEAAIQRGTTDAALFSTVCSQAGAAAFHESENEKALIYLKQEFKVSQLLGDRKAEARSCGNLIHVLKVLRRYDEAATYGDHQISILRGFQDRSGESRALYALAGVYHAKAKHIATLTASLALPKTTCLKTRFAHFADLIAFAAASSESDQAASYSNSNAASGSSLRIAYGSSTDSPTVRPVSYPVIDVEPSTSASTSTNCDAEMSASLRDALQRAAQLYEETYQLSQLVGDISLQGRACGNWANAVYMLGDYSKALQLHRGRHQLAVTQNDIIAQRRALVNGGNAALLLGDATTAIDAYRSALSLVRSAAYFGHASSSNTMATPLSGCSSRKSSENSVSIEAQTCFLLATAYLVDEQLALAAAYFEEHYRLARRINDRLSQLRSCIQLSSIHSQFGNRQSAVRFARRLFTLAQSLQDEQNLKMACGTLRELGDAAFFEKRIGGEKTLITKNAVEPNVFQTPSTHSQSSTQWSPDIDVDTQPQCDSKSLKLSDCANRANVAQEGEGEVEDGDVKSFDVSISVWDAEAECEPELEDQVLRFDVRVAENLDTTRLTSSDNGNDSENRKEEAIKTPINATPYRSVMQNRNRYSLLKDRSLDRSSFASKSSILDHDRSTRNELSFYAPSAADIAEDVPMSLNITGAKMDDNHDESINRSGTYRFRASLGYEAGLLNSTRAETAKLNASLRQEIDMLNESIRNVEHAAVNIETSVVTAVAASNSSTKAAKRRSDSFTRYRFNNVRSLFAAHSQSKRSVTSSSSSISLFARSLRRKWTKFFRSKSLRRRKNLKSKVKSTSLEFNLPTPQRQLTETTELHPLSDKPGVTMSTAAVTNPGDQKANLELDQQEKPDRDRLVSRKKKSRILVRKKRLVVVPPVAQASEADLTKDSASVVFPPVSSCLNADAPFPFIDDTVTEKEKEKCNDEYRLLNAVKIMATYVTEDTVTDRAANCDRDKACSLAGKTVSVRTNADENCNVDVKSKVAKKSTLSRAGSFIRKAFGKSKKRTKAPELATLAEGENAVAESDCPQPAKKFKQDL